MVNEARILARFDHPHIVSIFGVCWGHVSENNENSDAAVVADILSIILIMELAPLKSLKLFLLNSYEYIRELIYCSYILYYLYEYVNTNLRE